MPLKKARKEVIEKKIVILSAVKRTSGLWELIAQPEDLEDHIIGLGLTLQEADQDVLEKSKKLGNYTSTYFE